VPCSPRLAGIRQACEDDRVTEVYLEIGKKKVFACALDWPGWCRAGRDEQAALSALRAAAPRFAAACDRAGIEFDLPGATARFDIAERVTGSATTDFGALDVPAASDASPVTGQDAAALAALAEAAWAALDLAAAAAPPVLRKGPRGGGRDRDAIVAHVLDAEVLHARMLGLRWRPLRPDDAGAAAAVRAGILAAILASAAADQPAVPERGRRPPRFVARRTAWHALDHAWEIQDRHPAP
jgi:hypothetical protein